MDHSKTAHGYIWPSGQPNALVSVPETALQVEYPCPSKDQGSTDFYIRCGGYEFRVHRDIIHYKIPKLHEDFKHAVMQRLLPPVNSIYKLTLGLNEYEPQTVRRALQFCYTGELQLEEVIPSTDEVLLEQKRVNNPDRVALRSLGIQPLEEENGGPDQNMQAGRQSEYKFELRVGNSAVHLWVSEKSPEEVQNFTPTAFSHGDLTTLAKTFLFAVRNSCEELLRATILKYEKVLGSVPGKLNSEVWMKSLKMMNEGVFQRLRKQPLDPQERQHLARLSARLKTGSEEKKARESATAPPQQPGTVSHLKCANCNRTHPGECWKCSFCERYGHLNDMCFKNPASTSYRVN